MPDLSTIPNNPGCYLFKDHKGIIIYIGKAKNLKKRVTSYFTKNHTDEKTLILVKAIKDIDFIVTNSEMEALILENNLIKKHTPKYNIDLKDSKRYAYVMLTDEDFPRILLARRLGTKGRFFGPFTSAEQRDYIIAALKKTFRFRTCRRLPKKPCLRYHIGLCDAPCAGLVTKDEYSQKVESAAMVLKGKISELASTLEKSMITFSKNNDFERAMELRDQIAALSRLKEKQAMERQRKIDEDIINFIVCEGKVYLTLFNISKGILLNKKEFIFEKAEDFFDSFIVQHYSENEIPKELILPRKISPLVHEFLEQERKTKVTITIPKIGEKKNLLELVKRNIELSFFGNLEKIEELRKAIKLQEPPNVIECFDISHLSGSSTVGSMVQFRNARPDKSNYRRFKIRTVSGIDDFRAIAEVVRRRYSRLKKENKEMPNLIVIDGGKGQLQFALKELSMLNLKIPTISLAKKFEEIYVPGMPIPIRLSKKTKSLRFLQEIRDEAHRFAIAYNRLLRGKGLKG